jgi:hypothetical protein
VIWASALSMMIRKLFASIILNDKPPIDLQESKWASEIIVLVQGQVNIVFLIFTAQVNVFWQKCKF